MTHDPIAQVISVSPTIPASPVVVADAAFLTTLAKCEREIAHLTVNSPETNQAAAVLLQRLTAAGTKLEAMRKALKEPFLKACRDIDEAPKGTLNRIDAAKRSVNGMLVQYKIACDKAVRESEEAKKKAAEQPKKVAVLDLDDDGPAEAPAPVVAAAPVPKPAGINFRTRLLIDTLDVDKLPQEFVVRTANEKLIRQKFCEGWKDGMAVPECAGVSFKIDRNAVSDGKTEF